MDFSKLNGLIPAVVQDATTRDVLMVGFMNADALAQTRASGYVTFFSRTRNRLWTKGETSGNRLAVRDLFTDCDADTVLILATREGDGLVCHEGTVSCFTRQLMQNSLSGRRMPGLKPRPATEPTAPSSEF